ncbi:DNA methylase [Nostoc phage A1]|nr:DNA methylase [Nostoc phage A1]
MLNKIHLGDCVQIMKSFPSAFIDLTVTSPPYDDLRNYYGFSFDLETLISELYRCTKIGGVVVWVVADQTINGGESGNSFRQALDFMKHGFKLNDTMIYKKLHPKPEVTGYRYQPAFEYMFVFAKGTPKTFNPLKEPCKNAGQSYTKSTKTLKDGSKVGYNSPYIRDTKIKSNIWEYSIGYMQSSKDTIAFEHPAIFPEQLAEDHILSWSDSGETVFDPFMGSGTVAKVAFQLGRSYIGCEISEEYLAIAEKRLSMLTPPESINVADLALQKAREDYKNGRYVLPHLLKKVLENDN